ncbi:TauD/TfdA dioxygenase family protein [Nitrospirillum amazonense]|uniref:TauD/TfdA dioxygenase family protein n=1 Tax=Nitrospirillum amazonense TaxID=28077 RepID=UPI002412CED4|nr:TauD/TfdA family dioxygenase [Nitrospirillum amazonense]MDG3439692.1 TauD/TfdA family dioxygenase [Nitrospirillum amazonense]
MDNGIREYQSFRVKPSAVALGAELLGIDLSQPLTDLQVAEVKDAFARYQVIFFRDQQALTHDAHKAFGRHFGRLAIHSAVPGIDGHPEIVAIHADANSKYVAGENWHSDLSCDAEPPLGSILYIHTLPPVGGDTCFSSMYAAYDALSDRMKAYLDGLTAVHDANPVYHALFKDYDKRYPCNSHPVVRTHPVTGRKCLFVNSSYTTRIEGVPEEESKAVLGLLFDHVKNPNFQIRFRWEPYSVAFWDNRAVQHLAVWDYFPNVRSGFRVTVAGDRPY